MLWSSYLWIDVDIMKVLIGSAPKVERRNWTAKVHNTQCSLDRKTIGFARQLVWSYLYLFHLPN